jgi:hypothetical protein
VHRSSHGVLLLLQLVLVLLMQLLLLVLLLQVEQVLLVPRPGIPATPHRW